MQAPSNTNHKPLGSLGRSGPSTSAALPPYSNTTSRTANSSTTCTSTNNNNNNTSNREESHERPMIPAKLHSSVDATDDLDIILLHEDFPIIIAWAAKVKEAQRRMQTIHVQKTGGNTKSGNHNSTAVASSRSHGSKGSPSKKMASHGDSLLTAVQRLQDALLHRPLASSTTTTSSNANDKIPRGRYLITDSLVEDAIRQLREQHDNSMAWIEANPLPPPPTSTNSVVSKKHSRGKASRGSSRKKEPIAVKYLKWQTDVLMQWMIEHKEDPFPDAAALEWLENRTGLSNSQVVNWTTNVRKRNRKATCNGNKKPHHFIDFLFLALHRDEQRRQAEEEEGEETCPDTVSNNETTAVAMVPDGVPSMPVSLPRSKPYFIPPVRPLRPGTRMAQFQTPSANPVPDEAFSGSGLDTATPVMSNVFARRFHDIDGFDGDDRVILVNDDNDDDDVVESAKVNVEVLEPDEMLGSFDLEESTGENGVHSPRAAEKIVVKLEDNDDLEPLEAHSGSFNIEGALDNETLLQWAEEMGVEVKQEYGP